MLLDNINAQVWYLKDVETYGVVNKAHADFLNVKKEELQDKSLGDILSSIEAETCREGNRQVFDEKKQIKTEEWLANGNGEQRLLAITKTPKLDENGEVAFVVCSAEDITEHKQKEQHIAHINTLLSAIRNVNQTIIKETDILTVMEKGCRALLDARSYECCAIALLDDDEQTLRPVVQAGKRVFSDAWTITQNNDGDAPECVKAAIRSRDICLRRPSTDCGGCLYKDEGVNTLTVPMITGDDCVKGILHVLMSNKREVNQEELSLLNEAAQDLAFARDKILSEQAVQDKNAELNAIIQSSPYVMILVDSNRRVRRINSAGTTFAGDNPENLYGLYAGEALRCIHALDDPQGCGFGTACQHCPVREIVLSTLDSQRHHEDVEADMTFLRGDGEDSRSFLVHTTPLEISGEQMALVVFDDVTEYRRAEDAIRNSEERYRALVMQSSECLFLHDFEGRILDVNDTTCRTYGYSREELLSMNLHELDSKFIAGVGKNGVLEDLQFGVPREFEVCHRTKEGREFPAEVRVSLVEFNGQRLVQGLSRDISERKEAEKRQKEIQQFWQSTIDSLTSHVAILDENADIIAVNASWRRFADNNGLAWDNYGIGKNYLEFAKSVSDDSVEGTGETADGIRQLLLKQKEGFQLEYPCHSPYEKRWFRLNGTHFQGPHGLRVVLAHENITQRKLAEQELQQALEDLRSKEQQLVDQERQRALTMMASGIAHDFNNALSPIQGFSTMLLEYPDTLADRDTALHYLGHIQKAASNAEETIRRMRKFYRPREEAMFTALDLNDVVTDAVSLTKPRWKEEAAAAGKNIDIHADLGTIPFVSGNEGELNEMVTNLIFNAVDAMPNGGLIRITTTYVDGSVVLEFSDNGMGMPKETKHKCIDPFYTTKGTEGTGLGLAITNGIIQRHGGEMTVETSEGEGTTFRITLPLAQRNIEIETQAESRKVRPLKILVAEDEESQRKLLFDMLSGEEHCVDVMTDGVNALEKFNAGWYDLVITDRAMPELGGDELAKRVKEIVPQKPVIMLTGFGDMMDAAGETPGHVDLVVSKPISKEKMQRAIAKVVT